jgi:hypothetical protein
MRASIGPAGAPIGDGEAVADGVKAAAQAAGVSALALVSAGVPVAFAPSTFAGNGQTNVYLTTTRRRWLHR